MAEEQDVEYTFSDKYIKHTSTCGVFLTENLLSTVRRAQTSKREGKVPSNWVRQKREGERNWDGMSAPGRSCERGAATAHQEGPSLEERTAGTGRCGALTDCSKPFAEGKPEKDMQSQMVPPRKLQSEA